MVLYTYYYLYAVKYMYISGHMKEILLLLDLPEVEKLSCALRCSVMAIDLLLKPMSDRGHLL